MIKEVHEQNLYEQNLQVQNVQTQNTVEVPSYSMGTVPVEEEYSSLYL